MMQVSELKQWLDGLSPTSYVGIDDGGLTLVSWNEQDEYIEIGGLDEDEEQTRAEG